MILETVAKLIADGHGLAVVCIVFAPVLVVIVVAETILRLKGKNK